MTPKRWYVWEWLDNGVPVFLGIGRAADGETHPADVMWRNRNAYGSDLNVWLRKVADTGQKPEQRDACPSDVMHREQARGYFTARRKELLEMNVPLLSSRQFGSTVGGGASRGVIDPNDDLHVSVRAAADDWGLSAATVTRRCQDPKNTQWRFTE